MGELTAHTQAVHLQDARGSLRTIDGILLNMTNALLDGISKLPDWDRPKQKEVAEFIVMMRGDFQYSLFHEIRKPYLEEVEQIEQQQANEYERQNRIHP